MGIYFRFRSGRGILVEMIPGMSVGIEMSDGMVCFHLLLFRLIFDFNKGDGFTIG